MLPKRHLSTSPQEQSTDPRNRGASKYHSTNLIPIARIKHPTSFAVNYKNNSNIMVERDGSIVCQQLSKEPDRKKQNNHNHRTNNLTGNKETDKNNRQQYRENKVLQFKQEQQQQRNT